MKMFSICFSKKQIDHEILGEIRFRLMLIRPYEIPSETQRKILIIRTPFKTELAISAPKRHIYCLLSLPDLQASNYKWSIFIIFFP